MYVLGKKTSCTVVVEGAGGPVKDEHTKLKSGGSSSPVMVTLRVSRAALLSPHNVRNVSSTSSTIHIITVLQCDP